jgi:uncharacterized alpha-E superfamily protein
MLSRVADSIYWMSSYIERAENVARCVEVNVQLTLDLPMASTEEQWQALVTTMGDLARFRRRADNASRGRVIHFLAFDTENPNSILSCLTAARENARMIREVITAEMWEQLNTFYFLVCDAARDENTLEAPQDFLAQVRVSGQQFTGVTDATMSHGEAWRFCRLGRKLERADKTTRILDVKYFLLLPAVHDVGTPIDDIQWAAVLRSASALEMYRKRHGRVASERIVDFLLLEHRLGQLRADLAFTAVADIIAAGLHEYLDVLQGRLNRLNDAIRETFFVAPATALQDPMAMWSSNQ